MRRTIRNFSKLKVAIFPAGYISLLTIVGFNVLGLMDEQHPAVETIRHGLVMLAMFAAFYLIGHLLRELGADDEDDDIWPTSRR
jgi:hypothetical protein